MGQEGKEKAKVHTSSFRIRISAPKRQSFVLHPGKSLRSVLGTGRFKSKSDKISTDYVLCTVQRELRQGASREWDGWVSVCGFACLQLAYPLSGHSH